jgi:hypothetical protein
MNKNEGKSALRALDDVVNLAAAMFAIVSIGAMLGVSLVAILFGGAMFSLLIVRASRVHDVLSSDNECDGVDRLLTAMLRREYVLVLVDLRNGVGEVTKPQGWRTLITEIRRPALDVNAYGHLDPVVVVEDDVDDPRRMRGLSISLRPSQVVVASLNRVDGPVDEASDHA